MDPYEILFFIVDLIITIGVFVVPFWVYRFIKKRPSNKILSFAFVFCYFAVAHVSLMYLFFGSYNNQSQPPILWFFVSTYFLIADNPILMPKLTPKVKAELITDEDTTAAKKPLFRSNREKLLVGFIVLLLAGYFVSGYCFYSYHQTMEKENASLQRKIDDYAEVLERRSDYGALLVKSNFFDAHAVFVGKDQYYYHTYDCPSRPNSFWIYNVNYAVSRGYHPCPTCKPPTSD